MRHSPLNPPPPHSPQTLCLKHGGAVCPLDAIARRKEAARVGRPRPLPTHSVMDHIRDDSAEERDRHRRSDKGRSDQRDDYHDAHPVPAESERHMGRSILPLQARAGR